MPKKNVVRLIAGGEAPDEKRSGETYASAAYGRLKEDVINGVYAPGAKLRIQELCERYEVGPSPVREALNRLTRDGLVKLSDHKGFSVTPISRDHLEELTTTRCWLNELALRQSILKGDSAWEESVVLAHHRLSRSPRYSSEEAMNSGAFNSAWEIAHRAFHSTLIAACGSSWLIDFCEQLFDAADRYRHLSRGRGARSRPGRDEHKEMVDAVVARDADAAVALLNRHFMRTCERVRDRLPAA
jgi:GntR family carbon starvation induced transcriptional regulator